MTFEEIENKVVEWADERGIYKNGSASKQIIKLGEEFIELIQAEAINDKDKIADAIGDMLVVLTNITVQCNLMSLGTCYREAYDQIKDRKGKMVNGIFVKE